MLKRRSIKTRLLLPTIIILLIIFLTSSSVIILRESDFAKNEFNENIVSFSKLSLNTIITNHILYYDSGFIKYSEIIRELFKLNNDLTEIKIITNDGIILFDSIEIDTGKYNMESEGIRTVDEGLAKTLKEEPPQMILINNSKTSSIDIIQPYFNEWGMHEYSVIFTYTLSNFYQTQATIILSVLILSILFFVVSFLMIFVLFERTINKSIKQLIKGAKEIEKGIVGTQIDIDSNDEFGELADAFNSMSKSVYESQHKLEDNIKQKERFIIQLGHDLRTPLGPIMNMLPLLESNGSEEKRKIINIINRNFNYINNLVSKTIEFSKLNHPKLLIKREQLNLRNEIEKIIRYKTTTVEKTLIINNKIPDNIEVYADRINFEELITNLIENSLKYSYDTVKIEINALDAPSEVEIWIKDNGIGLDMDQIDFVFDEFYKVDSSRHDIESSGLGLSICKRIVERHNGRIWITSEGIGKGITVHFTLKKRLNH